VSSGAQAKADTIAAQRISLPEYAATKAHEGWELVRPVEHYEDNGKSASHDLDARDGFKRLLADAAAGEFDIVLIRSFTRLTRTPDWSERAAIIGPLQRAKVKLAVSAQGQLFDLDSRHGDLQVSIFLSIAAADQAERARNFAEGRRRVIDAGRRAAGQPVYGLKTVKGAWDVDLQRAAIILDAAQRIDAGESCYSIERSLDAEGIPTGLAGHIRLTGPRAGRTIVGSWRGRLTTLLRNPAYRGEAILDKARGKTGPCPVIVPPDLWHRVQARLDAIKERRIQIAPRARQSTLLEGIIRCECGGDGRVKTNTITRKRPGKFGGRAPTDGNRVTYRYYECETRKGDTSKARARRVALRRIGSTSCGTKGHRIEELDALVWSAVGAWLEEDRIGDTEQGATLAIAGEGEARIAAVKEQLASADAAIGAIDRRMVRAQTADLPDQVYAETMADLHATRKRLVEDRAVLGAELASAELALANASAYREGLAGLRAKYRAVTCAADRQAFLRLLATLRGGKLVTLLHDGNVELVGLPLPRSTNSLSPVDPSGQLANGPIIKVSIPIEPPICIGCGERHRPTVDCV